MHGESTGRIYNHRRLPGAGGEPARSVVAVRCLHQGNAEAQRVASDVLMDLDPRWILVVGIAGGIASDAFTLGDVIVSSSIRDLRVEAVKSGDEREYAVGGGHLEPEMEYLAANLPAMRGDLEGWNQFGLPRPDRPEMFHGDDHAMADVRTSIRQHFTGDNARRRPIFHTATILSSDRQVEDAELVAVWKKYARQGRAIEMESAGVYSATRGRKPFLAIRGISEIVGAERDGAWARYACESAAAFTHALIRAWPLPGQESELVADSAASAPETAADVPELSEQDLVAYVTWLRERYGQVEMIGLGAGELRMPLDDVYVPLRFDVAFRGRRGRRDADGVERSPGALEAHGAELELRQKIGQGMAGQRSVELGDVFHRAGDDRNAFILGRPGSGKTTALKKLLWTVVKPAEGSEGTAPGDMARDITSELRGEVIGLHQATVPIFLRLRNFTGPLLRRPMAEYLQSELESIARDGEAALPAGVLDGLGARLWKRGDLLLLLDGLDEVADAGTRGKICTYLEDHLPEASERGIRAVVSSRPSGVSSDIDLDRRRFARFNVHGLNDQQIEKLVTAWFRAAELALDKGSNPTRAIERGEASARSLATRLSRSENKVRRIRELATNPMLLTLLCIVVMKKFEIPQRRVDFFRECLDILLGQWIEHRSERSLDGAGEMEREPLLSFTDAIKLLLPVAWTMHEEERKYDLSRNELRRLQRPVLRVLERARGPLPFGEVLRWLHQITGVLTRYATHEDGSGEYGFMHLSLQEYLAARYAANSVEERELDVLAEKFGDPWWQEVVLLFVAFAEPEGNFVRLLQRVLDRGALDDPDAERRQLIEHCIEDAHGPDLTPLVEYALDGTRSESSRLAALDLLMSQVDDEVLYGAARLACASESDELRGKAERLETRPLRPRAGAIRSEASEPTDRAHAFHVFVCHMGEAATADALATGLQGAGLKLWRDSEQLDPDADWQEAVDETVENVAAVAVLVGAGGVPWNTPELRVRLSQMVRQGRPVVLIYTPALSAVPERPLFLHEAPVVDMRQEIGSASMSRLMAGLRGEDLEPEVTQERARGDREIEPSVGMAMLWLPGGQFMMGSGEDDEMAFDDSKPAREVSVSGFWMAETVVTNAQYEPYVRATGEEPGYWSYPEYNSRGQPVVGVTWYDAVRYCNFLSSQAGLTPCYEIDEEEVRWNLSAEGYRLPIEAEWEYACRAGTTTRWSFGDEENELWEYEWYIENSSMELQPVARKKPNPWGLYDMHGNVLEWCWDVFAKYPDSTPGGVERGSIGASGVEVYKGGNPLLRGGGFRIVAGVLCSAFRFRLRPVFRSLVVGFRCVRGAARQP